MQQIKEFLRNLKEILKTCPDFERALSRLAFYKSGFQDLLILKKGISISLTVKKFFINIKKHCSFPNKLNEILNSINDFLDLNKSLEKAT